MRATSARRSAFVRAGISLPGEWTAVRETAVSTRIWVSPCGFFAILCQSIEGSPKVNVACVSLQHLAQDTAGEFTVTEWPQIKDSVSGLAWSNGHFGVDEARKSPPQVAMILANAAVWTADFSKRTGEPSKALDVFASEHLVDSPVDVWDLQAVTLRAGGKGGSILAGKSEESVVLVLVAGRTRQATLFWQLRGSTLRSAIKGKQAGLSHLSSSLGQPPPPCLCIQRVPSGPLAASASPASASVAALSDSNRLTFALLSGDGVMEGYIDPRVALSKSSEGSKPFAVLTNEPLLITPGAGVPRGTFTGSSRDRAAAGGSDAASFLALQRSGASATSRTKSMQGGVITDANRMAACLAVGLCLTPFHVIVTFERQVIALNRRNGSQVWHEVPPAGDGGAREAAALDAAGSYGDFFCACQDSAGASALVRADSMYSGILVVSRKLLWQVSVLDEARGQWRILSRLASNESDEGRARTLFLQAAEAASASDSKADSHMEVQIQFAEWLLRSRRAVEAASVFARTSVPFETVALRLATTGFTVALIQYVRAVLEKTEDLTDRAGDVASIHQTVLSTWLVELYLSAMDEATLLSEEDRARRVWISSGRDPLDFAPSTQSEALEVFPSQGELEGELATALSLYSSWIHPPTALRLALSHGRTRVFETMCREFNSDETWRDLVLYKIQQRDWSGAIDTVLDPEAPPSAMKVAIKSLSPLLAAHAGDRLLSTWQSLSWLSADDILPGLLELSSRTTAVSPSDSLFGRLAEDRSLHTHLALLLHSLLRVVPSHRDFPSLSTVEDTALGLLLHQCEMARVAGTDIPLPSAASTMLGLDWIIRRTADQARTVLLHAIFQGVKAAREGVEAIVFASDEAESSLYTDEHELLLASRAKDSTPDARNEIEDLVHDVTEAFKVAAALVRADADVNAATEELAGLEATRPPTDESRARAHAASVTAVRDSVSRITAFRESILNRMTAFAQQAVRTARIAAEHTVSALALTEFVSTEISAPEGGGVSFLDLE
jgi:hypothetical protein